MTRGFVVNKGNGVWNDPSPNAVDDIFVIIFVGLMPNQRT